MTIVALCLAGLFGVAMVKAWKRIDKLEEMLDAEVEQYETGWADGYDVGTKYGEQKYQRGWEDGRKSAKPTKQTKKITVNRKEK
jgi:hypothetical protein